MQISEVMAHLGVIDAPIIRELGKWGFILAAPESTVDMNAEQAIEAVREALERPDSLSIRETDFDVFKQYLNSTKKGTLHIDTGSHSGEFEVRFGRTNFGDYILPWRADSIVDLMQNEGTYLIADGKRIYFSAVREVFYGDAKAFMVCSQGPGPSLSKQWKIS